MDACLLEHARAHREVREPVAARVGSVRADSADLGGEVEHEFCSGLVEQPRGVVHRGEVVLRAPCGDDLVPLGLEPLDEMRAEETAAAGYEDAAHRATLVAPCAGRGVGNREVPHVLREKGARGGNRVSPATTSRR